MRSYTRKSLVTLAGQKRLFYQLAHFSDPLFLVGLGIRTPRRLLLHLLRVALRATFAESLEASGTRALSASSSQARVPGSKSLTPRALLGNWRLTFAFENGDAILVDYQAYH